MNKIVETDYSKYGPITENLKQGLMYGENTLVNDELPSGGIVQARGLLVDWQEGPIQEAGHNGCFVEDLIVASIERLQFYQDSKFKCEENALAIDGLKAALEALESRTKKREKRGVEGTHNV